MMGRPWSDVLRSDVGSASASHSESDCDDANCSCSDGEETQANRKALRLWAIGAG